MRFKRILAAAFALALSLPLLTVTAHPGGTDSSGGHTDSSTGDYHYHHGYPAHSHKDTDGDGNLECPYRPDWEERQAAWDKYAHSWRPEYNWLIFAVLFCALAHLLAYAANYCKHLGKSYLCKICDIIWVVLAILTLPFSLPLSGLIRHLRTVKINLKNSSAGIPRIISATPESDWICATPLLRQSEEQHRQFCAFLLNRSTAYLKSIGLPVTGPNVGKTFAVLFYISIKIHRPQDFANEIYRQFRSILSERMSKEPTNAKAFSVILEVYRKIAPELNSTGITPTSAEGLDQLHDFLLSHFLPDIPSNENAKALFTQAVADVILATNAFRETASPYYVHRLD